MDKKVDTLIIGASFWGIGYAMIAKETVLILDRGIRPGSEFMDCYKFGTNWEAPRSTGEAAQLYAELEQRNIIGKHRKPVLQTCSSILSALILRHHLEVLLSTDVIQINDGPEEEGGGYRVTAAGLSAGFTVTADRIIDTASQCHWEESGMKRTVSKSINSMLCTHGSPVISINDEQAELCEGERPDLAYLKLRLPPEADWITARGKLLAYWASRPPELAAYTLAAVGKAFEYTYSTQPATDQPGGKTKQWFPSGGYDNLLQAFEHGCISGIGGAGR